MKRAAVAGLVAAVLVLGAAFVWWLVARTPGADAAAQRYLDALSSGDWAQIEPMLPPTLAADERAVLQDAFAGAEARIAEPVITAHDVDDRRAVFEADVVIDADIALDGADATVSFALVADGDGWVLDRDALVALTATPTLGTHVQIGEAVVAGEVALLPAVYRVQAWPSGVLAGVETVALTDAPVEVALAATVSPDADATVQAQLDAYLAGCTAAGPAIAPGCGIHVPWGADLAAADGFAYRVEQLPTVSLSPDVSAFTATGGDLVVTVNGTTRAGAPASVTYRDADWSLRGSVTFDADGIALAVF